MYSELTVVFKYAKALFESAKEQNISDRVRKDINLILEIITKTPELNEFFKNRSVKPSDIRKACILTFFDHITETTKNFLELLINKHRIYLLEYICKRFIIFDEQRLGIIKVKLEYAGKLPENIIQYTEKQVFELLKSNNTLLQIPFSEYGKNSRSSYYNCNTVIIEPIEKPYLLAGIRMTIGNVLIDRSLKASLKNLKQKLISVSK